MGEEEPGRAKEKEKGREKKKIKKNRGYELLRELASKALPHGQWQGFDSRGREFS